MGQKIVEDKEIDIPWTFTSLSGEDITAICDVIMRPGSLVGVRKPDRGD